MTSFNTTFPSRKLVSYSTREKESLQSLEKDLMNHYGWNYSQLHKHLGKERGMNLYRYAA